MQSPSEPTGSDRVRTAPDHPGDLDADEVHDLLRSGRRRRVVGHLLAFVGEPVPVDALATAVAREEHERPADGLDAEVRERVALTLVHSHLPRLEAAGVVVHDRQRGSVTATPRIEALEPHLAVGEAGPDGDAETTLLAGLVGGSLATLVALGRRRAAGLGAGLLVAMTVLWTTLRRDPRRDT